jgi:hypothetical protein
MIDEPHVALLPKRSVRDELRAIADADVRVRQLALAKPARPDPGAFISLTRNGEVTFEMVELPLGGGSGRLTFGGIPGRVGPLTEELDALVSFGVRHLVCLIPRIDLGDHYRSPTFVSEATARFPDGFHILDVIDYEAPGDDEAFEALVERIDEALTSGESVYVHCGAGCGRVGTFVSCLLARRGVAPLDAVERFREVRGCGPESSEQVAYVVRFAQRRARSQSSKGGAHGE